MGALHVQPGSLTPRPPQGLWALSTLQVGRGSGCPGSVSRHSGPGQEQHPAQGRPRPRWVQPPAPQGSYSEQLSPAHDLGRGLAGTKCLPASQLPRPTGTPPVRPHLPGHLQLCGRAGCDLPEASLVPGTAGRLGSVSEGVLAGVARALWPCSMSSSSLGWAPQAARPGTSCPACTNCRSSPSSPGDQGRGHCG